MLKKTKRPPGNYTKKLITSLAFMICVWGQSLQPVSAEGSRDLIKTNGLYRPYTEWLPGVSIAGIPRKTLLKVFVIQGETINLGSSVHKGFGGGTQDIVYRSPNGTQNGSCDVLSTGPGFIDTLAKETAGPLPATGGYDPCQRVATETGIYEVEFHGPSETSTTDPTPVGVNDPFPTDGTQEATVAAWDITVTSGGVRQPGRVFTNYLSLSMGGNSGDPNPDTLGLTSILFVQTIDGYRYRVTLDRLDPGNFIFFGNNRGFIDKTDNSNLYRSITAPDEALNFIGNVGLHLPTLADTSTNVTHRVFFNRPDSVTLGGLGIPPTATLPQAPPDFKFTGIAGNTTKVNTGGKFTFTTNQFGRYQIVIDTNQDGIYGNSNDRILTGGIVSGLNTVNWDGRDQANIALLVGTYNAKVYVTAGEYHFPLLDAESNAGGLRIIMENMENAPGAFNNTAKDHDGRDIDNSTVYYDDSNYTTKNGTIVNLDERDTDEIASAPRNALKGRRSSAFGRHQWLNLYGNLRGIDTWTYFLDPSGTATPIVIVAANTEVVGTKEVVFKTDADTSGSVTINDIMEYTVTYSNVGNTNATNFVIKDTLPAQLTYVPNSLSIVSQTPANNFAINTNYNGTNDVNLINPGTLGVSHTITIKFRAKVNAAAANISNQAIATFIPSGSVSTVTILTDAVPTAGGVTSPTTPGQIVTQIADDGINIGNDTSKTEDDDPTLFSTQLPPKLLLVKRITALNGNSTNFNVFDPLDATNSPTNQVSSNWPNPNTTYLRGKINGGQVEPGNILEYTIYFLSVGGVPAANTKICDLVPDGLEFVPTGFNNDTGISPNTGSDFGIVLGWDSTNTGSLPSPATPLSGASLLRLTGVGDADGGEFFAAGTTPSTTCTAANTNGAVVVVVGGTTAATGIPKATAPGTPTGAYGFFRFRAKVK
jgi:uncharacterized repeat protein (TIGR01451 family)